MQVEIPYVAPSQRQNRQVQEEHDSIVVVGQARQKRKRRGEGRTTNSVGDDKNDKDSSSGKNSRSSPGQSEEAEPFDFSAAPNILDDNPDLEDRKKKRQKKQSKGVFLTVHITHT